MSCEEKNSLPPELEQRIKECSMKSGVEYSELHRIIADVVDGITHIVSEGVLAILKNHL